MLDVVIKRVGAVLVVGLLYDWPRQQALVIIRLFRVWMSATSVGNIILMNQSREISELFVALFL